MLNNRKKTRVRIMLICLLLVFAVSSLLVLGGCSTKDKEKFWEKYGKDKAYNASNGVIRHATKNVSYYIDPSVTGNYRTAVEHALKEANKLTNAVNISISTNPKSKFVIKVANAGKNDWCGLNEHSFYASSGEIISSTITFNTYYANSYTQNMLKELVLHEIGHTFGLADLYANEIKEYSVMYYQADSVYVYTTYQEFDQANIDWYYN